MGCVTLFIYVFIVLIFYWFLNHFCICCTCRFVHYEAIDSTVSESFLYVGESFPQQNFSFNCTCGGLLGGRKGLFQSENYRSSKTIPQIPMSELYSLKIKKREKMKIQ